MGSPSVSLITVSYNSSTPLRQYWEGLRLPAQWEWIVVDNMSADDSVEVARQLGARVIEVDKNVGFSGANNLGARAARGEVLIFVNPDVRIDSAGGTLLAERVARDRVIASPQLLNPDGTAQENGRGCPFPTRKLQHMFTHSGATGPPYLVTVPVSTPAHRVVWVMGAVLAMKQTVFDLIGGWDDKYFIYYEDSDICLRALQLDIPTIVFGDIRWIHGWSRQTAKGLRWSVWKHEIRSAAIFYSKHPYCLFPVGRNARRVRAVELNGEWAV